MNLNEIKEALSKATPEWYFNGNEIVSRQKPRCGIGGFLTDEDNHLAVNAPQWLTSLVSEVERLETKYHVDMNNYRSQVQTWQEEHDRQIVKLSQQVKEMEADFRIVETDKERYQEQVEEMQKTLEWYADEERYAKELGAVILDDQGEHARQTLQSLKGD